MERIAPRNLYCEECSLQFENKLLFDLHISLKHRKRIQGAKVPEIYKEKSPKPQTKKKSISDHVIPGKPCNFDTVNNAISLHESKSSLKISMNQILEKRSFSNAAVVMVVLHPNNI